MSEFLALYRALPGEAPTVEGRLADVIEMDNADIMVSEYKLSDNDRAIVVNALRLAAAVRTLTLPLPSNQSKCK